MRISGYMKVFADGKNTEFLYGKPQPKLGLIIIPIKIEIPDSLFEPPDMPVVEVTIDESVLPQIRAINEHCEALQEAGVKIRLVDDRT